MPVELYKHQLEALGKMHNGCILKGGVGTGKSITGAAYVFSKELGGNLRDLGEGNFQGFRSPKDVYVFTTKKKKEDLDWPAEFLPFGISTAREVSFDGVQLTVDTWNNITKYEEVEGGVFIFDEQRLVGSGAWVKAFLKIASRNRWIMLSATPGDNWMDYIPVFIANGFYRNRSEFLARHVVFSPYTKFPKVQRYTDTGHLDRIKVRIVVDMPYARHTVRRIQNILVHHDAERLLRATKDRWHVFDERPIRDVGELFQVMRKIVNTDPDRLAATMKLMEKHPRLIIFYYFNYELDLLRTLAGTVGIDVGEWNGQKHESVPTSDRWLYLVQYTAGSEGWNCITTDAMMFWSLQYSYKLHSQAFGRIDRLNTPYTELYYYVLRSASAIDQAIQKALTQKRNFSEKELYKE